MKKLTDKFTMKELECIFPRGRRYCVARSGFLFVVNFKYRKEKSGWYVRNSLCSLYILSDKSENQFKNVAWAHQNTYKHVPPRGKHEAIDTLNEFLDVLKNDERFIYIFSEGSGNNET